MLYVGEIVTHSTITIIIESNNIIKSNECNLRQKIEGKQLYFTNKIQHLLL